MRGDHLPLGIGQVTGITPGPPGPARTLGTRGPTCFPGRHTSGSWGPRPASRPNDTPPAHAHGSARFIRRSLSGIPGPKTRNWLANLGAQPRFTFHLKHGVVADLPATATVIVDPTERRRVLSVFVEEFNRRHGVDSPWPEAVLDEWVERSPLAKVTFVDTD